MWLLNECLVRIPSVLNFKAVRYSSGVLGGFDLSFKHDETNVISMHS